jgi:glycosyltransferase involved in cell wall biosynthesis
MSLGHSPRVSIGVPVYNGETYLAEAIESILAQSYTNFELILCDNCSTDKTAEICQEYVSGDRRIKYVRNEHNLGAIPNFNRTFSLSTGDYFKWLAHDDVVTKEYVQACLTALEGNPTAVLCQSLIQYIDGKGENIEIYDSQLSGAQAPHASTRFAAIILLPHACNEVFGLIRRPALVREYPLGTFHGADRALMAELALYGQFIQLREPLLKMRLHPSRYTESRTRPEDRLVWHDTQRAGKIHLPTWRLYGEYLTMVRTKPMSPRERVRCYGHLLRWWLHNWNWARMVVDLVAVIVPSATTHAERIKHKLFGPRPGASGRKGGQSIFH